MTSQAYLDVYTAYGVKGGGVTVAGRALEGTRHDQGQIGRRRRDRLRATWHLFDTDEIPGVEVEIALWRDGAAVQRVTATTDAEGFFSARIDAALEHGTHQVRVTLLGEAFAADPVEGTVLVYPDTEGLVVLSDIDDTVLLTGVTDKLAMLKRVLLSAPQDLATFPGAPELYQRLVAAGAPLIFLSGSPWNLEPRLRAFFALRGFPAAPLLLKDFGVGGQADSLLDQVTYKTARILAAMAALPARRFLLIGDSGEHDPEIYGQIARDYPHRVAAVYIHRVTPEPHDSPRFAGALVFDRYEDAARDAALRGFI